MKKPQIITPVETINIKSPHDLSKAIQRIKKEKPFHKIILYGLDELSPLWWWPN